MVIRFRCPEALICQIAVWLDGYAGTADEPTLRELVPPSATVEEPRVGLASSVEGVSRLIDAIGTAIRLEPALFDLAVCAEMVFLDLPFEQRVRRIAESGFQVEIWSWTYHDIDALVQTGARFSSMVGHTAGSLLDEDGANALLQSAEESLAVAERLNCRRLLVFGIELGPDGVPLRPAHEVTGAMWLNAYRTLCRLADLGERAGVTFCLENLNTVIDHPGAPFARPQDTLALVEAVNRPGLRMMLDLYHAQIGEGNLIALLRRADSLIGEVQVADVPGRCEPGTGEINYSAIAVALKEMGYRGTVGLEAYASGEDKVALERFSSVFGAGATTAIGRQED